MNNTTGFEIAVIGMSGRFPGAHTIDEFWDNLKNGLEKISFFSEEEDESKLNNPDISQHSNYVNAKGVVDGIEYFDSDFFDCTPREVEIMDPQQRFLYECVWETLEDAGYNSLDYQGVIGSYLGAATNLNWLFKVLSNRSDLGMSGLSINSSEFFSTRISHKFNLKGPSFTIQSACSTSLVAIHLACQALLSGECDMALAGGVKLTFPQKTGYIYQEGSIMSKDGHCRAFDASASGTVGGNGVGVVLLKRLEDAMNDGDHIYAMIKGSAVNNDGTRKVGYHAPSPDGQAEVIKNALYLAEVEPESISYVETHGTGTVLGDPIEIEGLNMAFNTEKQGYCKIGSVKTNIGHLDNAAGVAGFIKTVMALKNKQLPPSLNFISPNPNIDFTNSPFVVNTKLIDWTNDEYPLRAGVSSFGMGGTNAHVVLEETPNYRTDEEGRQWQMITLSAKTNSALDKMTENVVNHFIQNPEISLSDVAYTLHVGRKDFKYRKMLVCSCIDEAIAELSSNESTKIKTRRAEGGHKEVVFMFPGQGSQYVNMGLELYSAEPVFKEEVDHCFDILARLGHLNLKEILYPESNEHSARLYQTAFTQPILFIIEYALAKLLMSWGIKPDAMIGHSIGELVAACLSGVFTLEDALFLIYHRGQLMQSLPKGSMLCVPETEDKLKELIGDQLSIATVNGKTNCVVAGTDVDIDHLEKYLTEQGYNTIRLHTSHAFHSQMVEPILSEFRAKFADITFNKIQIPFISNVSGDWVRDEMMSPEYWVDHLRNTVRFYDGVTELAKKEDYVYLEVGPGKVLSSLVKQALTGNAKKVVINSVRHPKEEQNDLSYLLTALGSLWLHGVEINWQALYSEEKRYRLPLPTYPFERKRFFLDHKVTQIHFSTNEPAVQTIESQKSYYVRSEVDQEYIPPTNEKEQKITAVFEDVLGINRIGVNEDFFEIGGDSLRVMEVVSKLKKEFSIHINDIFAHPTASDLAEHVTISQDNLESLITRLINLNEQPPTDPSVEPESEMEEKIEAYRQMIEQYKEMDLQETITYNNILLTGVTGYLGVFLLRDLLQKTDGKIHLIIRGTSDQEAETRLMDKLNYYFDFGLYHQYKDRILIYAGDLAESYFGLGEQRYQSVCDQIDCIIHSAGNVSHFGKYEDSYKGNVETTKALIQFARTGKVKDFNHISTLDIANGTIDHVRTMAFTEYDCDLNQEIVPIYPKTKLEAEKLLMKERGEGLNINIFRLGNVLFDSTTGKFQDNKEQNAVYSVIKAYIKIGYIPEGSGNLIISCVNHMSEAIVTLFNRAALSNEIYHLENSHMVNLSQLLSSDDLRLGVNQVSLEHFLNFLHQNYDNQDLLPYISMLYTHLLNGEDLSGESVGSQTRIEILFNKTELILNQLGFNWKKTDQNQIKRMIDHCKEVNYL